MNPKKIRCKEFIKKLILFLFFAFILFSCDLNKNNRNYYTQDELEESEEIEIISFSNGIYYLNTKYLVPYFEDNHLETVTIYEIKEEVSIREIAITGNNTGRIQLFPGITGILASNGENAIGFVTRVQPDDIFIIIDEYNLNCVTLFRDIIMSMKHAAQDHPVRNIDPQNLYVQVCEIQDFGNIFYNKYIDYILKNGLPENLLEFFILQLSVPTYSYSLELSWTRNTDKDFASYEIYRSETPDFEEPVLIKTITEQEQSSYTGDIRENGIYYYNVLIKNTSCQRSTSTVVLAKYPSGVIIQLRIKYILADEYRKYHNDFRTQMNYFICVHIDDKNEDGISPDIPLSFHFTIRDFISNEEEGIYAWDQDDPAYGYMALYPPAVHFINTIYYNFRVEHNREMKIKYGYVSPFKVSNIVQTAGDHSTTIQHIFGDAFTIPVETDNQWETITRLADSQSVSYIEPMYISVGGIFDENDTSRWIHLDWRCYPLHINSDFVYNPTWFHSRYTIHCIVLDPDKAEKRIEVRKDDITVERADFNLFHIKMCPSSPAGYFCKERHHKDSDATNYKVFDTFHQFECSTCKTYVKEEHTWLLTPEEENQAKADKNQFFNERTHWENECIHCSFRKGEEKHQADEEAGWYNDYLFHGMRCKKCQIMLNSDYHTYEEWDPLDDTRLHHRTCTICGQTQVRPHSKVTNWIPAISNESNGHAKYCSECWVKVEPYGLDDYLPHEPEGTISFNETIHWQYCRQCRYHCHESYHNFTAWIDLGTGRHQRECRECAFKITQFHNWSDWTPFPLNFEAGHVRYCLDCDAKDPFNSSYYDHTPEDTWSFNTQMHWKACAECGFQCDEEVHKLGNWLTDDDYHWKKCSVCEATIDYEKHICNLWIPDMISNDRCVSLCEKCMLLVFRPHEWGNSFCPKENNPSEGHCRHCVRCDKQGVTLPHNLSAEWDYDTGSHWHTCRDCGYKCDIASHTMTDWEDIGDDKEERSCEICGYSEIR